MSTEGTYDALSAKVFLIDDDFDCVTWDGTMYINKLYPFHRMFKFFEELVARANETLDAFLEQVPVANDEEFRQACTSQIQMLSKLTSVAGKPYLNTLTMEKIKQVVLAFDLNLEFVEEDGIEKIKFDNSTQRRWDILKLLDDDYLGSDLTDIKYEVNSKKQK